MESLHFDKGRTVLPLVGISFEPGKIKESIASIEDAQLAEIARAEACYFSADATGCVEIVKKYLTSEDVMLRLSADVLYVFGNLTLRNARESQASRLDVRQCMQRAFEDDAEAEIKAACVFAYYLINIFLHVEVENEMPALEDYISYLPIGQRLLAISVMSHGMYLKKDYEKAQGVVQTAMLMADKTYPISFIYLHCIAAMCRINKKDQDGAVQSINHALSLARKDGLFEPFIEYHGLLQGVLEICLRKSEPEIYKKLVDGIIAFSRGWMDIHNSRMNREVTDLLTPLEFSIAMLACRDWTNKEIALHMDLSVNTVKHYVSNILEKLQIDKREKIKDFVIQ